ncbi:MAG TPA: 23S rRNA (adenine(2503)-C(2))-methyltransferase RlmN [Thermomicrobiales bacterium]|nr:23S rRNA (adenine(2503)-C(2))-methyltransferase RlmN [Thermomicrobiales bacterium]
MNARFRPHGVFEMTLDELSAWFAERGVPSYRARQVFQPLYRQLATSYDEMTALPVELRQRLQDELPLEMLAPVQELATDDGETVKVLYRTPDAQTLETVLMFYPERATVCVSCQVGCAVGCSFCATGLMGLHRNLSAGEMVAQVVDAARRSRAQGRPLTNLVMMGMGEPFHNYAAMMKMIAIINDPEGMGFGARRITVSTSGVVPFIDRLAEEPYQVNLAISIHSANDELRSSLVPLNRRWPLAELIAAVRRYIGVTHRRVSFEYALISTVNDRDQDALQLAALLRGLLCHVNVIPLNPTPATPFERPSAERIEHFAGVLREAGIPATVRYSRGVEIAAACGQLRVEHEQREQAIGGS